MLPAELVAGHVPDPNLTAVIDLDGFDGGFLMCEQEDAGEKSCREYRVAGYFSHRTNATIAKAIAE